MTKELRELLKDYLKITDEELDRRIKHFEETNEDFKNGR